jgi:hypothetical protein
MFIVGPAALVFAASGGHADLLRIQYCGSAKSPLRPSMPFAVARDECTRLPSAAEGLDCGYDDDYRLIISEV